MKTIFSSIALLAMLVLLTVSCTQSSKKTDEHEHDHESSSPEAQESGTATNLESGEFSLAPIMTDYLVLKNALVADDSKAAASAGNKLFATLKSINVNSVAAQKSQEVIEIVENARENAEHISDNIKDIGHQREHFMSLSKDMNDLIDMFGAPQKLYMNHCPMYKDGKGAIWISEVEEIKNPYYGSKMLTCGSSEKEF